MKVGQSGGGFFFKPFSKTQTFQNFNINSPAVADAFGNWAHAFGPTVLTIGGRWIRFVFFANTIPDRVFNIEMGIGPVGGEVKFLPTTGAIRFRTDSLQPTQPYTLSFPFRIPAGADISLRAASPSGIAALFTGAIYIWD